MGTISRSLKPASSYLSPQAYRRPALPSRTISNSSVQSVQSEDGSGDRIAESAAVDSERPTSSPAHTSRRSRPIAIELPQVTRAISSASIYTPPEPLSARGDLPGGYFPMHEDPKHRITRTHPFHHQGHPVPNLPEKSTHSQPVTTPTMAYSHTPVATYLPTGHSDHPLPMGKYYPSNYETRNPSSRPSPPSPTAAGSRSPLRRGLSSPKQASAVQESEVRRRLQLEQYKRDMVAQASMAANEVLGANSPDLRGASKPALGAGLPTISGGEVRFGVSTPYKPEGPRLHPLGSPGPVTPMELEASQGGYLDIGSVRRRPLSMHSSNSVL